MIHNDTAGCHRMILHAVKYMCNIIFKPLTRLKGPGKCKMSILYSKSENYEYSSVKFSQLQTSKYSSMGG